MSDIQTRAAEALRCGDEVSRATGLANAIHGFQLRASQPSDAAGRVAAGWVERSREPAARLRELLPDLAKATEAGGVDASALWRLRAGDRFGDAWPAARVLLVRLLESEPGPAEPEPSEDTEPPALTKTDEAVLVAMSEPDGATLLSAAAIAGLMPLAERLSEKTIGASVRRLIDLQLAERPEGPRQGARLTTQGRRIAAGLW